MFSLESGGEQARKLDFTRQVNPRSESRIVVEIQEATQRKLLQGLDDTATERADSFKDFLQIIDALERVGAEKKEREKVGRGFRKANCI